MYARADGIASFLESMVVRKIRMLLFHNIIIFKDLDFPMEMRPVLPYVSEFQHSQH